MQTHWKRGRAGWALLSVLAALGLAVLPLVPSLGKAPLVYAANNLMVGPSSLSVTEGSSNTFNVHLEDKPNIDVVVRVVNPDDSEVSLDKTELTFTSENWSVDQPVKVTAIDDSQAEGTQTMTISLQVIDSRSDNKYDGKLADVQLTIMDNESGFILNTRALTVSESGTSDTFKVRLTRQPANGSSVVIGVASMDRDEVTVNKSQLTFTSADWDIDQTVTATGTDDSLADGSQTTDIRLRINGEATTDDAFDSFPDQMVAVTTLDNEAAGSFSVSDSSMSVSESGSQDSFTVVLNRQPSSDVVIDVIVNDSTEATASTDRLTFTSGNWDNPQTVTVTGRDDLEDDGDVSSTITLRVVDSLSDDQFDAAADITVNVTTTDNDPMVRVRPAALFPADGAKIAGLGTQVQWTQEPGTRWFELRVTPFNSDGPGIHLIISDDAQVATASYTVQDPDFGSGDPNYVMLPDMTYMWQVRTAQGASQPSESDWTAWSDTSRFETGNKFSNTITQMDPANGGSTVSSRRPTLMWSNSDDDVFYYEVQVSRNSNFCMSSGCPFLYWELRHGGVTSPLNSYTIPSGFPLENDKTYFWRVRPRIQGDGTAVSWSAAASFRTP